MSDFWKLYEHPKWQIKRLKIIERAGGKCEVCGETENALHVHHAYYIRGKKPWEYPDSSLHCLCKKCHDAAGIRTTCLRLALSRAGVEVEQIAFGLALAMMVSRSPKEETFIPAEFDFKEVAKGFGLFWGLDHRDVLAVFKADIAFDLSSFAMLKPTLPRQREAKMRQRKKAKA